MTEPRDRITADVIRREVLELLGYPSGRGGMSVRVSIVVVESKHASGGTIAKLHIDINEGARQVDLVLMLERLYLPPEEFSRLVLAPVFTPARAPATSNPPRPTRTHTHGQDEEEHREEAHAS